MAFFSTVGHSSSSGGVSDESQAHPLFSGENLLSYASKISYSGCPEVLVYRHLPSPANCISHRVRLLQTT